MSRQRRPRDDTYLLDRIRQLERRIATLETAARTRHAGVSGGSLRIRDGGRIKVGDEGTNLITVDPAAPEMRIDIPEGGGLYGTVGLGEAPLGVSVGQILRAPDRTTLAQSIVGQQFTGVRIADTGYVAIHHTDGVRAYWGPGGTQRALVWADDSGAGLMAADASGTPQTYLMCSADGTIYHQGPLVEVTP